MKSQHDIYGEYRAACRRYKKNPCKKNYFSLSERHKALLIDGGREPHPSLWWSLPDPEDSWVVEYKQLFPGTLMERLNGVA